MLRFSTDPLANPFYYLDYLDYLLDFVACRYQKLLHPKEQEYLINFQYLPKDARALYARLLQRKGNYFRVDRLEYREIEDLDRAIEDLIAQQFLSSIKGQRPDLDVRLRTKAELAKLGALEALNLKKASRGEIDEAVLLKNYPLPFLPIIQLEHVGLFELCQYLFFGNRHQNISEFITADLGIFRYETVDLESAQAFDDRSLVDACRLVDHMRGWAALLDKESRKLNRDPDTERTTALAAGLRTLTAMVPVPEDTRNSLLLRGLDKLHLALGQVHERLGLIPEALSCYQHTERAPARERCARLLLKQNQYPEARVVCEQILQHSVDPHERAYASRQLSGPKRTGEASETRRFTTERLILALTEGPPVEQQVINYLSSQNQLAHHTENHLYPGLFGLFFWDIIFAPIAGAFHHPFTRQPADLFEPDFIRCRSDLFRLRFDELSSSRFRAASLAQNWHAKKGLSNPFVAWHSLELDTLEHVVDHTPWPALKAIFERLLSQLQTFRSGFPDLLCMTAEGYRLIEVKGPGDRLQSHQTAWLNFLADLGIPTTVMHIEALIETSGKSG